MFYTFAYNDVDKAGADYVDFWPLDAPLTSIYFLSSDFGAIKIEGDKKSPCFTLFIELRFLSLAWPKM